MRVGALCAGYGGLELGLEQAGEDVDVVWYAEIDPSSTLVHDAHWPGVPNLGDLTAVDWSLVAQLEPVDLLTAGYPCQPFSQAGRRQGADDARHLWPHVAEAVRVLRPRRVLLENVAGHRSLGFGTVLGDLAAARYDVRWASVRASDAGAPHARERVFILATDTDSPGREGPVAPLEDRREGAAGRAGAPADADSGGRGEGPGLRAGGPGRVGGGTIW